MLKDKKNEEIISRKKIFKIKTFEESNVEEYEFCLKLFNEVKCFLKNNKAVFYLTDNKPENFINTNNLTWYLTNLLRNSFIKKLNLFFDLLDDYGFLMKMKFIF